MKNIGSGNPLAHVVLAIVMLVVLSFVPWSKLTDGRLDDFNLIEDLVRNKEKPVSAVGELVDPELSAAIDEVVKDGDMITSGDASGVHRQGEPEAADARPFPIDTAYAPERVDGILPIEDYTTGGCGLSHLRRALDERDDRTVRIAVIGDSYIEGDIFTQDLRRLLQDEFGGRGVGYMSMHSDFPGFRKSVRQTDDGWLVRDIRKIGDDPVKTIAGEYCLGSSGAKSAFHGVAFPHADAWSQSRFLFMAPADGTVYLTTSSGRHDFTVTASGIVQCLTVDGETNEFKIESDIDSLTAIGAWIDDPTGISLDCMSLRGNSGVSHRMVSVDLSREISPHIDYDLVVIEYGMNALSSQQSDYSSYGHVMARVVDRLRQCYPSADILMMGIGDRGQKEGTVIESMPTADAMVEAQRACARRSKIMFWDTREAMGGRNAVVDWRERGLVNADYIHLNHKGGSELAREFFNSLIHMLDESR